MEFWYRLYGYKNQFLDVIIGVLKPDGKSYASLDILYDDWQDFSPYCGFDERSAHSMTQELRMTHFKKINF